MLRWNENDTTDADERMMADNHATKATPELLATRQFMRVALFVLRADPMPTKLRDVQCGW